MSGESEEREGDFNTLNVSFRWDILSGAKIGLKGDLDMPFAYI